MRVRSCLFTALLVTLIGVGARAQAPNGISYQAVLRDADGVALANQAATLRLSLTSSDGTTVYFSETHSVQTDALGMMKVVLGGGQVETGSFAGVPWSSGGPIYLKVEVKLDGQTAYTPMGSEQLQSVPYALHAANGQPMEWLGTLASPPDSPTLNQAYYSSANGKSYVWDGDSWEVLAQDGEPGPQGPQGVQGLQGPVGPAGESLEWLGTLASPPDSPTLNQAYYNSTNHLSYIWDGDSWEVLAQDGLPGAQGPAGPQGPQGPAGTGLTNRGSWVSGFTYQPGDYVFASNSAQTANSMWIVQGDESFESTVEPRLDPTHWVEFQAPAGPQGTAGISIQWLGTLPVAPISPTLNQAYYNSVDKKSYVWDGDSWEVLAQDGAPGPVGPLAPGAAGQTLRHDGSTWTASSLLTNTGAGVGVNTSEPTQQLDVNGNQRLRGQLYDNANTAGDSGQFLGKGEEGVLWQNLPEGLKGNGADGTMAIWKGEDSLASLPNMTFNTSLSVVGNTTANPDDPIFEVKNSNGDIIFGVYQEGVRINIKDDPIGKGVKGGFAVGGLTNQTKAEPVEYLRITPDSARIYVKQETGTKGVKGGFAVGGLTNQVKGVVSQNLLFLAPDSARIYVKEDGTKGVKGGFAVGGLNNQTKSSASQFLNLTPDNYLIGYEAGKSITTGLYNSFMGYQAGSSTSVGNWNTFLGYQSGMTNTGNDNTFIGYMAGKIHQTKGGNVYIGSRAGANASNGEQNVLIGESAGYNITSGARNVNIGFEAGFSTTSGNKNIFMGVSAGYLTSTGNCNIFIGEGAGYKQSSGQYNTFIGTEAGHELNSSFNTFIGTNSGRFINSGNSNTFIGVNSAYRLGKGNQNTFIGSDCGRGGDDTYVPNPNDTESASGNTLLGFYAGSKIYNGDDNVVLGNYAGSNLSSGSKNVVVGSNTGLNISSGTNNVLIGYQAGNSVNSGSGNICIGYQAGYNGSGSNQLYIDNSNTSSPLIYGDFNSDLLQFNGNVGVGKSPSYKLDVNGDINISSGYNFKINGSNIVGSQWINSGSNIYFNSGSVAIGTTPDVSYKLKVDGNTSIAGTVSATAISGPLTGNVTGNVTGSVSGSAGNIGGVVLGKIYAWTGNVLTAAAGSIILSFSSKTLTLTNNTGTYVHVWWQGQINGSMVSGSFVINSPLGSFLDLPPFVNNGDGLEIHFGLENGSTYSSVWLQYSNSRVFGHYMQN